MLRLSYKAEEMCPTRLAVGKYSQRLGGSPPGIYVLLTYLGRTMPG